MKGSRKTVALVLALILLIATAFPTTAYAVEGDQISPRASYYLDAYNSYVCAVGNGDLEIWFEVIGVSRMDEIGTLRIMLYESSDNSTWTWKKTFLHEDYSTMLASNRSDHMSYVSYSGTAGKYYKAYVCIWAGKDGDGDTRYMWTGSERAT